MKISAAFLRTGLVGALVGVGVSNAQAEEERHIRDVLVGECTDTNSNEIIGTAVRLGKDGRLAFITLSLPVKTNGYTNSHLRGVDSNGSTENVSLTVTGQFDQSTKGGAKYDYMIPLDNPGTQNVQFDLKIFKDINNPPQFESRINCRTPY